MRNLGPLEWTIILAVIVLLFGAKKLPDLARGTGRALRIFKAETQGLMDDESEKPAIDSKPTQGPAETHIASEANAEQRDQQA